MEKKKIAILFGGCSSEYQVSLQSAYAVIRYLDRKKYVPVLIGITKQGNWFYYEDDIEKILDDTWQMSSSCMPVALSPNPGEKALLKYTKQPVEKIKIDAAFPVLHGKNGEDGTIQGAFALAGIPVVGCSVLSSALCMDKDRAHRMAHEAGVAVPKSFVFYHYPNETVLNSIRNYIGYPLFVKPVKSGSSYGITKASHEDELAVALQLAFRYDNRVLVEEAVSGFEVGCAIMGNEDLIVGEVDEIELEQGFFDYTEKYTLKTSAIHVPARISHEKAMQIKETAKKIYRALDCSGFARVDLFLTETGDLIFNEVNTIPGFTSHSRFPNMLKAVGLSFEDIIDKGIRLALESS